MLTLFFSHKTILYDFRRRVQRLYKTLLWCVCIFKAQPLVLILWKYMEESNQHILQNFCHKRKKTNMQVGMNWVLILGELSLNPLYTSGHNFSLLFFTFLVPYSKALHSDMWWDAMLFMEITVQRKHCSPSGLDDLFLLIIKVYDLRLSWFDMTWSSLKLTLTAHLCVLVCLCVSIGIMLAMGTSQSLHSPFWLSHNEWRT